MKCCNGKVASRNAEVLHELNELKKLGVRVPRKAIIAAKTQDLSQYDNISVSNVADLLIAIAEVY